MSRMVLIVDDSPQVAANLAIALEAVAGLEIRVAASGIEALEMIQCGQSRLAAVITDLEMPRMNGFQLIERLRGDPRWAGLPIIVSSGSPDPEAPVRALRLGADAYFSKPYSPAELRKRLERLLNEKTISPQS